MPSVRCLKCGRVNDSDRVTCEACGEVLLKGQDYEERLRELRDYDEFRKTLVGIILGILVLLLFCPILKWILSMLPLTLIVGPMVAVAANYIPSIIILVVFLFGILPMIARRRKVRCRYAWTKQRMNELGAIIKCLPAGFLETIAQGGAYAQAGQQGSQEAGPQVGQQTGQQPAAPVRGSNRALPVILAMTIFALAAAIALNNGSIPSIPSIGGSQKVAGRYECHLAQKNLGQVAQSDQTWAYVFRSDGSYTTYLDGHQQYSGTWSQSAATLAVNVPAIPGISSAYTFKATVSRDASSFTTGGMKFVRVK